MPSIAIPVSLRGQLLSGVRFQPSSLFSANEPGIWLDPSDLTTLFQDTAGTQPVTAPGQTVALALDKSKGLVLGAELVVNGDGSSGLTGWTTSTWTVNGSNQFTASSGNLEQSGVFTPGKWYVVEWNQIGPLTNTLNVFCGVSNVTAFTVTSPAGRKSLKLLAAGDTRLIFQANGANTTIDNISVKELPGFHATQATAASRPTYGVVPVGGRRNLLTYTEQFDNAAWTKTGATATAQRLQESTANSLHWAAVAPNTVIGNHTFTVELKAAERTFAFVQLGASGATVGVRLMVNLSTGAEVSWGVAAGASYSAVSRTITSVGDGWYRIAITASSTTTNSLWPYVGLSTDGTTVSYTGDGVSGILVRKAQFETGSTATAYQRVGSSFDVTEAGVPSLHYLSFDGVDDFLITPTITPGIDKAQVFAGVRKLSDTANGNLVELSGDTNVSAGSFYVWAPEPPLEYSTLSRGSAAAVISQRANFDGAAGAAPITSVVTATHDISGDLSIIRHNGVAGANGIADKGTGNFLAYPLYIGRRGGTSNPFNGLLYSLIVRFGANLEAGTISQTETWVNSKTGAY